MYKRLEKALQLQCACATHLLEYLLTLHSGRAQGGWKKDLETNKEMASKSTTLDWEEARAEFFQETYPSESLNSSTSTEVRRQQQQEVRNAVASSFRDASVGTLESRSSRVSIHLNRTASTTPADAVSPTAEETEEAPLSVHAPSSSKTGTSRATAKARMRAAVQGLEEDESDEGEIEVVDFTDENLATEVESWQNQKRLRDLALPLSQKKTLRLQYEKCPKIKLTRMRSVQFAFKRFAHWLCKLRGLICQRLVHWSKPLACIDRHRGGEMFAALQLHKILIFVTSIISLTVLSFILLPYMLIMCDFSLERCTQPIDRSNATISLDNWWMLQHYRLFFYYSYFSPERAVHSDFHSFLPLEEQHFPLIYLVTNFACLLGVCLYLFRHLVVLIKGVTWDETADTWFKNIFASWNHNMVCQTSSKLKHRSIYRQMKQKIQLARSPTRAKTFCTRCLWVAARCLSALFTLIIWACIILSVHLATRLRLEDVEDYRQHLPWLELGLFLLPSVLLTLVRLAILPLAALLDKWEYYPFNTRVIVFSLRLFVSRAIGLLTFVTTLYHSPHSSCWEDRFCHQILTLASVDFLADVLLTLVLRFPRVLLASLFQRRWSCSTKLDYNPYETVTDLTIDLGLIVLGLFYCPVLPFYMGLKLTLGYGLRLFHIWVNCSASRNIHSTSCLKFLFVGFSSVMVLFSSAVFVYAVVWNRVSNTCGPAQAQETFISVIPWYRILTATREQWPVAIIAYVMAALVLVLLFGLYISHLKRLSIERDANELKCQLAIATQEKCYLISKIKRPNKPCSSTHALTR